MTTKRSPTAVPSSTLFLLENIIAESDAWTIKTGARASTLEPELMHEEEKQEGMHHFSSEHGPGANRAAGANMEIDAGTLIKDIPASILCRCQGNEKSDGRRQW